MITKTTQISLQHKVRDVEVPCTIRSKQAFVTCNLAPPLILLMASKMEGSHFSKSRKEEEPAIDIVNIDSHTNIISGGSTSQTLAFSGTDQATSSVPPQGAVHRDGGGGDGDREVLDKDCGRERLKRHREEVAGRVMIPDTWGQENLLKDWIDCSTFDELLAPKEISSAREALVAEERRKRSPRLSIASRC
ncbi:uncharacterized protein LOC133699046 isoform X1 [Populus nigra]|uniref:uncharacterized protein LOC133699046 isoform X1 n=2 Tax=Populus nigra TaxID=3691 RepID=UPI002B27843A|nr:uncharacterized protein LOC133699046 isoform X1 [Populus nigra]